MSRIIKQLFALIQGPPGVKGERGEPGDTGHVVSMETNPTVLDLKKVFVSTVAYEVRVK